MLRFAKSVAAVSLIVFPAISFAARDGLFLERTNLKCISDGIETVTGAGQAEGLTPSPKFLALVGFGMQRYQKDTNGNSGLEREVYQQKIIEFIQANGFCLAEKVDGGGRKTQQDGYGGIKGSDQKEPEHLGLIVLGTGTRDITDDLSQNSSMTKEIKQTVKLFGFDDIKDIRSIFMNDNFSGQTPAQRQKYFRDAIANNSGSFDKGLTDCFNQMKNMQTLDPTYNHKASADTKRSPQSIKVCEALATSCELEDKKFCSLSVQIHRKSSGSSTGTSAPTGSGPSIYNTMGNGVAQ